MRRYTNFLKLIVGIIIFVIGMSINFMQGLSISLVEQKLLAFAFIFTGLFLMIDSRLHV